MPRGTFPSTPYRMMMSDKEDEEEKIREVFEELENKVENAKRRYTNEQGGEDTAVLYIHYNGLDKEDIESDFMMLFIDEEEWDYYFLTPSYEFPSFRLNPYQSLICQVREELKSLGFDGWKRIKLSKRREEWDDSIKHHVKVEVDEEQADVTETEGYWVKRDEVNRYSTSDTYHLDM